MKNVGVSIVSIIFMLASLSFLGYQIKDRYDYKREQKRLDSPQLAVGDCAMELPDADKEEWEQEKLSKVLILQVGNHSYRTLKDYEGYILDTKNNFRHINRFYTKIETCPGIFQEASKALKENKLGLKIEIGYQSIKVSHEQTNSK